jgi:Tol biopolymer transport system component
MSRIVLPAAVALALVLAPPQGADASFKGDAGAIAFSSRRSGGDFDIVVRQPDGSMSVLTDDPGLDLDPAWSPDGSRIAWSSDAQATGLHIWIMDADGSDQTRLTTNDRFETDPAWSPDGTRIAYVSRSNIW